MRLAFMALGLASLLVACGTPKEEEAKGSLALTDAHNYQSSSALSIPTFVTAAGVDIEICFDQVTKDIQCHDVAPTDIKAAALTRFPGKTPADVQPMLGQTTIPRNSYDVFRNVPTVPGMCAHTQAMALYDAPINLALDYNEAPDKAYMMMIASSTEPGLGTLSLVFVQPLMSSNVTRVDMPPGCSEDPNAMAPKLTFSATLSPMTLSAAGAPDLKLDWSQVTKDSTGADVGNVIISKVLVGFYPNMDVPTVQSRIIDLEHIDGSQIWEAPIESGDSIDLALATSRTDGTPFTGFNTALGTGTWIVALLCETCQNPAPIVLTVVTP
jgi:hypothetical protein